MPYIDLDRQINEHRHTYQKHETHKYMEYTEFQKVLIDQK